VIEIFLAHRGPTSADDADCIFLALGPYNENKTTGDRADGNEAILDIGVRVVEDLKVVDVRIEEFFGFVERDAVFPLVCDVLGFIPRNLHGDTVSQRRTPVKRR